MGEPSTTLERAWRSTCRVLFGDEIGDYAAHEKWLAEMVDVPYVRKSSVSGKQVAYSTNDYSQKAKCISLDEIDYGKKCAPLNINQIKDIDGIVQAIQDRIYYTGNVVLGNSEFVEKSSNISDGFYISNTTRSGNSKCLAYCTLARLDNSCFGSNAFSQSEFCLKCHELTRVKRSFELWMSQDSTDCYYSHGLKACTDCIFSFNMQNKKRAVGNLELDAAKYRKLKEKLLAELAGELKEKKRLPSLLEIVAKSGKPPKFTIKKKPDSGEKRDKAQIEKAFSQAMHVILGIKPAEGIDAYGKWLVKHTRTLERQKSAVSGKEVFLAYYGNYCDLPKDRLLSLEEAKVFGRNLKISEEDALSLSFGNAHEKIRKIAFFNTDIQDGQNPNDIECAITIDAANSYMGVCIVYSKYCAFSFWPRSCEYIFGSDTVFDSQFCINCYNSVNLKRCFEAESCENCSDAYFCHNCENVHDSMFCFNVKNLKHAVGNVENEPAEYAKVKAMLLAQIGKRLEKSKSPGMDIYSL